MTYGSTGSSGEANAVEGGASMANTGDDVKGGS